VAATRTMQSRVVNSEWITNYKELEEKHGHYRIDKDDEIKSEGSGFRVPIEVIYHHQDLLRAPLTPSPEFAP
jgi:hypothetical protein